MYPLVQWLLFLHILAALWTATGLFSGAVVRGLTRRAGSPDGRILGARAAWRLTKIFTLPGLIVVGALGIDLVARRGHAMGHLWVHASLAVYFLMLASILFFVVPHQRRAARAADAGDDAGLQSLLAAKLPGILSDVNALGVVVLTLLMVLRPV